MSSPLPIEVTPTQPPSQAVRILGTELYIGPAHADADKLVLVCLGPGPLIQAIHGPAVHRSEIPHPCSPSGASPIALIRLLRASACVLASDITLLTPDGTPVQP